MSWWCYWQADLMLIRNPGTPAGKHRSRSKSNQDPDYIILLPAATKLWPWILFLHLSVIHSVHRGGLPQCMLGYHPPGGRPPKTRHPPGPDPHPPKADHHPPGTRPPQKQTPPSREQTPPPREANSSIRSTSGRYASYWNAYLYCLSFSFFF